MDMTPDQDVLHEIPEGRKRSRANVSDSRYPRKRSVQACHVCRARKTKCDNGRPACGFCVSVNVSCSYDDIEKDHSSFDPASLEILRQLGHIITSQQDLLRAVRFISAAYPTQPITDQVPASETYHPDYAVENAHVWGDRGGIQQQTQSSDDDQSAPNSDLTLSPAVSSELAAIQWFGILTRDANLDDAPSALEGGCSDGAHDHDGDGTTPLQCATRIVDDQTSETVASAREDEEEVLWQAPQSILLLEHEQALFRNFLGRLCSWIDLFDITRRFSTIVPRLATRNAGLLNAILALSSYDQSLDQTIALDECADQNSALQYYYQTLHYVQKAMRYVSYQRSPELMATTLIISTYEMLRGSQKDWQHHLQGVFWILRSRQIEVETSSLESTIWWAWLRQDIWVAFREKRRTYSTWVPKKSYLELSSHEIASRAVWILAQVINFCAVDHSAGGPEQNLRGRLDSAKTLRQLLQEWRANLTIEFTELHATGQRENEVFKPRFMHPQCFGLAMQLHHVSKILLCVHEPSFGTVESYLLRHQTVRESIEVVCGIGSTITDSASCILSSQCLFIVGMFMQDPRQRSGVLEMLEEYRVRHRCLTLSLSSELKEFWARPNDFLAD